MVYVLSDVNGAIAVYSNIKQARIGREKLANKLLATTLTAVPLRKHAVLNK